MSASILGKKQYMLIGKLLVNRHPDIANKLIGEISTEDPKEKDLAKIPDYFRSFCTVMKVDPVDYTGPLKTTNKVDVRKLFISVMLHFYSPHTYIQPSEYMTITMGLTRAISRVVKVNDARIWLNIREAIMMERLYDDYKKSVSEVITKLNKD